MASEEGDGDMIELALAITCLLKYVEKLKAPYVSILNGLSDKVRKELSIQIQKVKV